MKCIVMKWLPWSWKTTWANQQKGYKVLSTDVLRWTWEKQIKEALLKERQKDWILENKDSNIIIDQTNANIQTLWSLMSFCSKHFDTCLIEDMEYHFESREEYYKQSSIRNMQRESWKVAQSVIDLMYLQMFPQKDIRYIICDLDGTIAKMGRKRSQYLNEKNYDMFYGDEILNDEPIKNTIELLQIIKKQWIRVIIVSGRSNICCPQTIERLHTHDVPYDYLLMRNSWDKRPDAVVKKEIMIKANLRPDDCIWVFDDRTVVVDMRRGEWFFVFDVNQTREVF